MDIKEKFRDSVERLFEKNMYLATEVTKLGYPTLSKAFPTAWVAWDNKKNRIQFCFNPNFLKMLTDEEFDFIVAHEARHIINCHLFTLKDKIDGMKKNNEPPKEINRFVKKFWIAEDCVANDTLIHIDGFDPIWKDDPKVSGKPAQAIYGENIVGIDCYDLTAMDVYYLIDDDKMQELEKNMGSGGGDGLDDHEPWETFMNPDGSFNEDFIDAIKDFIESHVQNSAVSQEEQEQIMNMKNSIEKSSDKNVMKKLAGNSIGGKKQEISKSDDNIKWNMIMSELVEFRNVEDNWNRPNRNLISVYPKILLPSWKDAEKQLIVAFIDKSGSMDRGAVNKLSNILRNCPNHIHIKAVMFDTRCVDVDLEKEEPSPGGGTNFEIIEEYCKNMKKYPKAVLVLTDGHGTPVEPKHPNRWIWILYGSENDAYCKNMKHYNIDDLLK